MPVSGDLSTLGPAAQTSISLAFDLVNEAGESTVRRSRCSIATVERTRLSVQMLRAGW